MSQNSGPAAGLEVGWSWSAIDTVLLDMDGTLLDLRFDNYFWLELVPHRYAQARAIPLHAAQEVLNPKFAACRGTLNWYCTDYWSRELDLDIAGLKYEIRDQVRFLEGAERFLATVRRWGKRLVLVTNAHRDSLKVKARHTELERHFDRCTSTHDYGVPKEEPAFWQALREDIGFHPQRTLFVDDSLAVLRTARAQGIEHLVAITQPDSTLPPREVEGFPAVRRVAELLTVG
jgi:putative hydrolase of the HAD superfamily